MARPARCLACERTADETPLVMLEYRGTRAWICTVHLPMLIHSPEKLAQHLDQIEPASRPELER